MHRVHGGIKSFCQLKFDICASVLTITQVIIQIDVNGVRMLKRSFRWIIVSLLALISYLQLRKVVTNHDELLISDNGIDNFAAQEGFPGKRSGNRDSEDSGLSGNVIEEASDIDRSVDENGFDDDNINVDETGDHLLR